MVKQKTSVFVDTGAFYARYVVADKYHQDSLGLWNQIREEKLPCLTTNFVLSELITLFVYRFGTERALQAAREIYNSDTIQILSIDLNLELEGLEWIERFNDQTFSMTDATSFAVMKKSLIETAFTFDSHFVIAGFQRLTQV